MLTHSYLIMEQHRHRAEDLRREAQNHRLAKSHCSNPRGRYLHKIVLHRVGGALSATGEALRSRYAV